jgi:hypothetical protein
MAVIAAALKHMIAAGMDADAIVAAVAEMESAATPPRSKGAERQARYRERGGGQVDAETRAYVFERDGEACQDCGATEELCIDHIKPLNKGGGDEPENLQVLCRSCNGRKKDRIRKQDKRKILENQEYAGIKRKPADIVDDEKKPLSPHTPLSKENPQPKEKPPYGGQKENPSPLPADDPQEVEPQPPPKPKPKATRLPSDWQPSPDYIAFALTEGLTEQEAHREADRFRDYWPNVKGEKGRKLDWAATWRNWVRRHTDDRKPRGGRGMAGGAQAGRNAQADGFIGAAVRNASARQSSP